MSCTLSRLPASRTLTNDELGRMARQLASKQDIQRYPRLAQSIEDATRDFLAEGLAPAEAMIQSLVDCQLAHINTSHPDFVGGSTALKMAQNEVMSRKGTLGALAANAGAAEEVDENGRKVLGNVSNVSPLGGAGKKVPLARLNSDGSDGVKDGGSKLFSHDDGVVALKEPPGKIQASEPQTDEEMLQVLVTRILLGSYFSISRSVLADTVPKAVMHFLVNSVARGLQQHLIQNLYHPNIVPSMLQEHPETETMRAAAAAKFNALSAAAVAIGSMPGDLSAATGFGSGRR